MQFSMRVKGLRDHARHPCEMCPAGCDVADTQLPDPDTPPSRSSLCTALPFLAPGNFLPATEGLWGASGLPEIIHCRTLAFLFAALLQALKMPSCRQKPSQSHQHTAPICVPPLSISQVRTKGPCHGRAQSKTFAPTAPTVSPFCGQLPGHPRVTQLECKPFAFAERGPTRTRPSSPHLFGYLVAVQHHETPRRSAVVSRSPSISPPWLGGTLPFAIIPSSNLFAGPQHTAQLNRGHDRMR